jgi:adenylate cyclase class 2
MMAAKQEIEIKFRVYGLRHVEEQLKRLGFSCKTPRSNEMNTLYDFPSHALTRRGELLRLRRYGDQWKLTHKAKGKTGRHKSRTETETMVENGGAVEAIFGSLGLKPIFRYEKFRSEWSDGAGDVVLDETPIGNFAEIEGTPKWIDATAKALGVRRSAYITENYASLFFKWKKENKNPAKEMTFAAVKSNR